MDTQHGGSRPNAGRPRQRYMLPLEAARALKLIAWGRYGRPTIEDENSAVLAALVMEAAQRSNAPQA